MSDGEGNAEAIIKAVERLSTIESLVLEDGCDLLVSRTADGSLTIADLQPYRVARLDRPERRKGTATFTRLESFVAHANRFRDRDSAVFAVDDADTPRLSAVYDYHEARGSAEGRSDGLPRFGVHRAQYDFPLSEEWSAWVGVSGTQLSQSAFAAFLEDHLADVLDPSAAGETIKAFASTFGIDLAGAARLAALAKGLTIRVDQKVTNVLNPSTGEASLLYEEAHRGEDGPIKIPGGFAIAIPVTRNGPAYQIPARLRYRVKAGSVTWVVSLHRTDKVFLHAFDEACEFVRTETGLPLLYGQPE